MPHKTCMKTQSACVIIRNICSALNGTFSSGKECFELLTTTIHVKVSPPVVLSFSPGLESSHPVILTGQHYKEVSKQLLAVLKHEGTMEVQSQDDHVHEKGEVGGPVHTA